MAVDTLAGVGRHRSKADHWATHARDTAWTGLFRVGGIAALIAGLVFRRNLDAELMLLQSTGVIQAGRAEAPSAIMDWFAVLQDSRLLGLTLLGLFDMVNYALVGLIFLALCVALRRVRPASMVIAGALTLTGVMLYLASNQALALLALSEQYSAATTAAQRSMLLVAGQVALAIHQNATYGGSGIYPSFFLVSTAGLMIAFAMMRSNMFGKATAWIGVLANVVGLGYYIALIVAPALVALPLSVSAVFLLAWYVLIGGRLLQLSRGIAKEE